MGVRGTLGGASFLMLINPDQVFLGHASPPGYCSTHCHPGPRRGSKFSFSFPIPPRKPLSHTIRNAPLIKVTRAKNLALPGSPLATSNQGSKGYVRDSGSADGPA